MKKKIMKITALCVCAVLAVGGIAFTAYGLNTDSGKQEKKSGEQTTAESTESTVLGDSVSKSDENASDSGENVAKDETVYVLAGADGSVQKIIVSDWIKNALRSQTLQDKTDLTDVETVKGDEKYTLGSGHSCVWDAQGHDIYYQGNIEKELPVEIAVSYKLDGKTISPSELAGKSGKVTIRFDYTNKQYEEKEIDGKKEKIYVPFAMLTGVLLDDDVFTNVEVSNGKIINDGSRTAVVGIAFPGLQENLAISEEKFQIPDYVEITGDAKDFSLGMTVTLATNELFSEVDTENIDSVDDLKASMKTMTDAMGQLMGGSSQLYDGISTLLKKSGELTEGIGQLAAGAGTLKNGVGELDAGAAQLQSGAAQLCEGLNTLTASNEELNGGAGQIFETLLATANTQLQAAGLEVSKLTIGNYKDVLNGVIASLDENAVYEKALSTVTNAVEEKRPYIEEQVTAAVQKEVLAQVTATVKEQVTAKVTGAVRETVAGQVIQTAAKMDQAAYEAAVKAGMIDEKTQAAIEAAIEQQMKSEQVLKTVAEKTEEQMQSAEVQATVDGAVSQQMQTGKIKETIAANVEAQIQKAITENMASEEVQAQLAAASEGAKSVIALKTSLDSYNTFYLGLQTYTNGVAQAASGAAELKAGTEELKTGTGKLNTGAADLYSGAAALKNGAPALVDGITQLRDGSMELSDGLKAFNEEGIQKLADAVDGDLDDLVVRLKATQEVSKNYRSFAGVSEDMSGQVKFIYRMDAIEAEEK